jgi:hypothetical protein
MTVICSSTLPNRKRKRLSSAGLPIHKAVALEDDVTLCSNTRPTAGIRLLLIGIKKIIKCGFTSEIIQTGSTINKSVDRVKERLFLSCAQRQKGEMEEIQNADLSGNIGSAFRPLCTAATSALNCMRHVAFPRVS